ncbi:MAG: DUF1064 domain-containing protein [Clostridia bacterium]|nr:DUF1064 domain-containing protein [Clostridia bacterium]
MIYRSKYGNKRIETPDGMFDSKAEYERWCELQLLQRIGSITDLKRQVKFVLIDKSEHGRELSYIADFTYQDGDEKVIEDVKSEATKTPLYRLKKRLVAERYGIDIKEVKR